MDVRYRIALPSVLHFLCLCISLLSLYYLGQTATRLSHRRVTQVVMNHLSRIAGLHTNLPRHEFVDILSLQPVSTLKLIRNDLFAEAQACQNTIPDGLQGLPLVSRRDSALRPIASIFSEDIWCISQAIENNPSIPRTFVKKWGKISSYSTTPSTGAASTFDALRIFSFLEQ